jgi:prepilin-type N-terminal cleavage/methylation domain-containing protein
MLKRGFTLLEILLVITLIGILLATVLRLINPQKRFGDVNNLQRKSDVLSIYTAINQYREDNRGNLPAGITTTDIDICQPGCVEDSTQIDITTEISKYIRLGKPPVDPSQTGTILTGYTVYANAQGKIVVSAPLAENEVTINTIE